MSGNSFGGLWCKFRPSISSRWKVLRSTICFNQAESNHASSSSGINHSVLSYAQTSLDPIFWNSTGLKKSYLYWILILGMNHTVHTEGWTNLPLKLQLTYTRHLPFDFAQHHEPVEWSNRLRLDLFLPLHKYRHLLSTLKSLFCLTCFGPPDKRGSFHLRKLLCFCISP
jgi:hypothetical protein